MPAIHIDTIYESEAFRMLSPHMKDRTAAGIVYAIMCADNFAERKDGLFAEFERYCKDSLEAGDERDREHKELTALREEAARRDNLKIVIGDLTMEHIFRPKGITNIADVNQQALWDRVEFVLSEIKTLQERVRNENAAAVKAQTELQILRERHKAAKKTAEEAGYPQNAEHPHIVIDSQMHRIERLTEDNAMYEKQLTDATGAHAFRQRMAKVHEKLFHDDPTDVSERTHRFAEEAIELVEALGMPLPYLTKLADYVYCRGGGEPRKEVGDVVTTLISLCDRVGIDYFAAATDGLKRLEDPKNIERIRAKRKTRHGRGPLPGLDPHVDADPPTGFAYATMGGIAIGWDDRTPGRHSVIGNTSVQLVAPLGGKTASDIVRENMAKDDSQVASSGFSALETLAQPGDHISPTFPIDGLPGTYALARIK